MIFINEQGQQVEITNEEWAVIQAQATAWSKESHLAEINALHEAEFERRWLAAGYKTEEELSRAIGNPKNKFHAEAMLIDDYWWDGWDAIEAYGETVTEQNMIDPIQFVNNLENGSY